MFMLSETVATIAWHSSQNRTGTSIVPSNALSKMEIHVKHCRYQYCNFESKSEGVSVTSEDQNIFLVLELSELLS